MKAIMEKKAVNKTVICLMVENQPNVLARISSLVGRRSFNISTITASETNVSGITKITLVVNGDDENVLYQIIAQMKKLENVNEAYVLPDTNSLYRELLLVKIKATQEERSALHEMTEIYRGKVVGLNKESMIIELTGSPKKIDGFMSMLEEYDIIEVSRTGVTGMARDSSEEMKQVLEQAFNLIEHLIRTFNPYGLNRYTPKIRQKREIQMINKYYDHRIVTFCRNAGRQNSRYHRLRQSGPCPCHEPEGKRRRCCCRSETRLCTRCKGRSSRSEGFGYRRSSGSRQRSYDAGSR